MWIVVLNCRAKNVKPSLRLVIFQRLILEAQDFKENALVGGGQQEDLHIHTLPAKFL